MADETPNRRQSSGGRNTVNCHDKRNLAIKAEEMMGFDIIKAGLTQGEDHNDISIQSSSFTRRNRSSLTMAEAFKPGAKPIRTATTIRCHQVSCSRGMIFVSTANNTTKAIRISHERTMDLKNERAKPY